MLCTGLLAGLMFTISLPSFTGPLDQPTYRALPAQVAALCTVQCCANLVWRCTSWRAGWTSWSWCTGTACSGG